MRVIAHRRTGWTTSRPTTARTEAPARRLALVVPPAEIVLDVSRFSIPSSRAKWPIKQRAPESLPIQADRAAEARRQNLDAAYHTLRGFIERSKNKWLRLPLLVRTSAEGRTFGAPLDVYQVMSFVEVRRNRILFGVNVRYGSWQPLNAHKLASAEVKERSVSHSDASLERVQTLILEELRAQYPSLGFKDVTSEFELYRVPKSGERRVRLTPYHGFVFVIAMPLGKFQHA